ncbi:hypothetical protein CSUI_011006 [Cystoisospora suis]|uniref:Uncharacterized protein n=1 Tax=Cystoisospora suis TaxID=483139 RepID=A0A2C6KF39_9APIC|nr:hypothetical protein CSUI_011006 [Cystoisospora suis]
MFSREDSRHSWTSTRIPDTSTQRKSHRSPRTRRPESTGLENCRDGKLQVKGDQTVSFHLSSSSRKDRFS